MSDEGIAPLAPAWSNRVPSLGNNYMDTCYILPFVVVVVSFFSRKVMPLTTEVGNRFLKLFPY